MSTHISVWYLWSLVHFIFHIFIGESVFHHPISRNQNILLPPLHSTLFIWKYLNVCSQRLSTWHSHKNRRRHGWNSVQSSFCFRYSCQFARTFGVSGYGRKERGLVSRTGGSGPMGLGHAVQANMESIHSYLSFNMLLIYTNLLTSVFLERGTGVSTVLLRRSRRDIWRYLSIYLSLVNICVACNQCTNCLSRL